MTPALRKLTITAHVTFSVGWLGAVAAFLVLSIAGLTSHDAEVVRGAGASPARAAPKDTTAPSGEASTSCLVTHAVTYPPIGLSERTSTISCPSTAGSISASMKQ